MRRGRRQIHGAKIKRPEDLAIAGIPRCADPDPVARVKKRGESQNEPARRARGDHNAVGVEIDIIPVAVHPGDPLAQCGQAKCDGIAQCTVRHCAGQRGSGPQGCAGSGLAHLHVDDVAAFGFRGGGGLHYIHHDKGIDLRPG